MEDSVLFITGAAIAGVVIGVLIGYFLLSSILKKKQSEIIKEAEEKAEEAMVKQLSRSMIWVLMYR